MKKLLIMAMLAITSLMIPMSMLAAELQKIPIIYSDHSPPTAGGNLFLHDTYLPKIQKELAKAGYELDVTFYHAQSLYKLVDQVQAVEDGLIDITIFAPTFNISRVPLHEILAMPLMGLSPKAATKIWFELQETIPEFGEGMSKYFELYHFVSMPRIMNANEELRIPKDMKGKRVLASGVFAKLMQSIRAVPMRQSPSDWYTSLERGLADAVGVGVAGATLYHLDDVTNYHIFPKGDHFGLIGSSVVMNREKFNKLPAAVQKVLKENQMWASDFMTQYEIDNNTTAENIVKDKKHNLVYLTDAEMKQWYKAAEPIHKKWIKKMNKKGLPGQKVYDETVRLAKKYNEFTITSN